MYPHKLISRGLCPWVLILAVGCSYSTTRPFRDDIQTVHVEMFQSKEFRRGLEFALTEAIAKRIHMDTPYRVIASSQADTTVSGEVLSIREKTLGTDFDTDLPRETGLTIVARWRWKDLRSGEILRDYPQFIYTTTYLPPIGESFDTGATRCVDGLAGRIVAAMETEW